MPTDKTPVLTTAHLDALSWQIGWTIPPRRDYLREILSVIRTIVESGGTLRLAGEDEVIVKLSEIDRALLLIADGRAVSSMKAIDLMSRWLAVSPTAQEPTDG